MGQEGDSTLKYLTREQQEFAALPEDKKGEKVDSAHITGIEMNERIGLCVSPDEIIHGINLDKITTGATRLQEAYKHGNEDLGKVFVKEKSRAIAGHKSDALPFADEALGTLFVDARDFHGETIRELRTLFKDIPVIDLGAGQSRNGYLLASFVGAKGYIGVEPYNWRMLTDVMIQGHGDDSVKKEFPELYGNSTDIPYSVAAEDALTFLKRLPDHSVGVFSFGTDHTIIIDRKYIRLVIQEIRRVIHPKSALLTLNSVFSDYVGDEWQKERDKTGMYMPLYIIKPKAFEAGAT